MTSTAFLVALLFTPFLALLLPAEVVIEGRVTDSQGRPLEGATVSGFRSHPIFEPWELRRRRAEETVPTTTTGPDGTFCLGELKAGEAVDLHVQHSGHVPARLPDVKPPTAEPLQIALRKARGLSGRVVGPEGKPIAGAALSQVYESRTSSGGESFGWGESSRPLGNTDGEGVFRVGGVEPGSLDLRVRAEGYRPKVLKGLLVPEEKDLENLEIVLDRSVSVEVRVLSTEEEPMAGEWVVVEPERLRDPFEAMRLDMDDPSDETDERGITRIEVPKSGRYVFSVASREVFTVVEVAQEGTSVELRVPTALQVSDRVVDDNGEGAPDARVTRDPLSGNAAITGRLLGLAPEDLRQAQVAAWTERPIESEPAKVSPDGGYRIEGLKPGEWHVTAVTASGHRAHGTVRLAPGVPEANLDLEFGGLILTGRVLVDGVPLARAEVEAWAGSWKVAGQTRTDYTGAFTLPGLRRGVYRLVVRTQETGSDVSDSRTVVDLEENRAVEVRISTGRLSGKIVSGAAGAPVADATVLLDSLHKEIDATFSAPSARSGGDGTFQSSRLAAGTYKVTVRKDGFAPAEAAVEVRPGEEATVEVVLQPQDAP
ncbi:MAG TPA: carboxypeptidase-like regulatory domain-containing protein [Thermoanaerobaculia bacterium]|nr:carboxypeptidase-like regulatory domain-containing protein [Thermoanaerobaculia bacterium]